ncbi:cation:proton antiporter domain-containing protein [Chryseobacterium koreense]|uniref:Sodium:proton antiporter n=1 Tax=Chryseobacterium koreense CCUG 49689 TaxID=1304281 RepID=A0A0J7J2I2_9FLAO|nr:cation:proton antiporter [Chryseobacterium koreense]KMQ72482.1 sodium:proton antiporter [Chryseobacterium koreense CCUG 49689]MBB5333424.1 CPA2 family monovalent cation:H+ antiporter-2 [Chryseobacterium koreense]
MGHLPKLIEDLALILIVAAFVVLIFRRIKQPLVLGYIIAGFLVSPNFKIFPSVVDNENIKTLAEIGVIFLLFGLGLEFSFKKLMNVGGSASITAFVEIIFITIAGYFTGKMLGWNTMDSMFLGGMLASSSTTIIIRAFDELGVKTKNFAKTVFGVLVVEDIVVILLMVLLSTIAVTKEFEGTQILYTVAKLLFFLILWFILGIFLLPTFLKRIKNLVDDEILMILSIGLCLGMVLIATSVGFSAELGAFVMGSIIAETTVAEKIEHTLKSVKDLFGAVFFVSVGMMINYSDMITYAVPILAVTFLTIFGKLFSSALGALISGQPLKQSVQVGMSMAQIGEFAFIVATLGLSLGVISPFLFPVAVGVSAITTFTTPYMIKLSEPMHNWLVKIIPPKYIERINKYSSNIQNIQAENSWQTLLKNYGRILMINGIVIIAIYLLFSKFLIPKINENVESNNIKNMIGIAVPILFIVPFLWALMMKRPKSGAYNELWTKKKYNRGPLLIIEIFRIGLGIAILGFFLDRFASTRISFYITIPVAVIIIFLFNKRINLFYNRLEKRFIRNLNDRSAGNVQSEAVTRLAGNSEIKKNLAAWDVHILELEVNPLADYVGKPLVELQWREKYGINIGYIKRGEKLIHTPERHQVLMPYDKVGIITTDDDFQVFRPVFDKFEAVVETDVNDVKLGKILINHHSPAKNKSIRESGIRDKTDGLVVAIRRGEERILNPKSTEILLEDDIIFVVGDRKKIEKLNVEI